MKPNTSALRVDVPDDDSNPATPAQPEALGPEPSSRSRPKYSPGALFATAAAKIGLGSRPGSKQAGHGHGVQRDSVNPLSRAAHAASYRRSIELNEQLPEVAKAKAAPKRRSIRESFLKAVKIKGKKGAAKSEQNLTVQEDVRLVSHNDGPLEEFETNRVVTSKYNVVTFLPRFLFEMFSRAAYLYFLLQAALSWWSVVSPFGGVGSTAALVFVLVVAGVKAVWEDTKRHQEDKRMNTSITHKVNADGSVTDMAWTDVKVGDFLMVKDDELFPADMVCIYSALPDKVCFIKTTNLDGETNLKIRRPMDLKGVQVDDVKAAMDLRFTLTTELPNRNLHKFRGKLSLKVTPEQEQQLQQEGLSPAVATLLPAGEIPAPIPENGKDDMPGHGGDITRESPVTMSEMLLRGCMLKNSHYVVGMVVYTGRESRIQMNSSHTPLKVGSFDRFLNLQISLVIFMQIAMALFCAIANYIWQKTEGKKHYYLALNYDTQGIYSSWVAQICINFLTFWILLSYLVPISLFVTMEIVKFWQGFVFINFDPHMRDPKTGDHARCRNSGLNEDLGKVEYVFSDKTGTLTSNEMQLRMIAIKGVPYGTLDFRLEDHPQLSGIAALKRFDARLAKAAASVHKGDKATWASLLNAGGSSHNVLSHATSYPDGLGGGAGGDYETVSVHSEPANPGLGAAGEANSTLGQHLVDFWTNVCICQSLIIEENPKAGGLPIYQGPSPDEVALVEGARQVGFEFKNRSQSSVVLSVFGEDVVFEVLNVMEYTSERGCMSVIARAPDGTIRLYCKGSDTKVMAKLRGRSKQPQPALHQRTEENLSMFARQGLRTLVLGTKIIHEDDYVEWDARYQEAATSFEDRDTKMNNLGNEIEQDLELVGVTAIEDKLQDGVPTAIATLLEAGVRVWMITGDKQETAINIGVSCKLVSNPETIMILNVDEKQEHGTCMKEAGAKLHAMLEQTEKLQTDDNSDLLPSGELAVDGPTLTFILADKQMTRDLAELSSRCAGVVICRSSPSQKAAIVRMMMDYELRKAAGNSWGLWRWYKRYQRRLAGKMLSIGDGANDVAMIQTADVGVGIMGKEGRQAVNNSDYAIAQFRFLVPLLLVHGTLSYYRLARLIKYSFYKNIAFAFLLFYYQFYNGFSGQALVDSITAAVYNVVFTSMPILLFSILDRPVKNLNAYIRYPQLYDKRHLGSLTTASFWKTGVLLAAAHGAACFFFAYYSIAPSDNRSITDVYSLGKIAFVGLLGTVTLEVCLTARYWTWLFGVFVFLSYFLVYPFITIFPLVELGIGYYDPANVGVGEQILRSPTFWFVIIVTYIVTFGMRFAERTAVWVFRPHDTMILAEKERKDGLMTNLSGPSRKRLSELGLDGWRSRGALNQLDSSAGGDEEAGRSVGSSSAGGGEGSVGRDGSRGPPLVKFAEDSTGTPRSRAAKPPQPSAEESLRSHYSASPAHSHASGSPGANSPGRSSPPGGYSSPRGNPGGAASPVDGFTPTPKSKASELSLRELPQLNTPASASAASSGLLGTPRGGASRGGGAAAAAVAATSTGDSLESWAGLQPAPGSAGGVRRVTYESQQQQRGSPRGTPRA